MAIFSSSQRTKKEVHQIAGGPIRSAAIEYIESIKEIPWKTSKIPGLVNIQKAIENGHRNSGFSH